MTLVIRLARRPTGFSVGCIICVLLSFLKETTSFGLWPGKQNFPLIAKTTFSWVGANCALQSPIPCMTLSQMTSLLTWNPASFIASMKVCSTSHLVKQISVPCPEAPDLRTRKASYRNQMNGALSFWMDAPVPFV